MIIYPLLIKPCPWKKVRWLARMQIRPRDARPVSSFRGYKVDEALSNVASEIAAVVRGNGSGSREAERPAAIDAASLPLTPLAVELRRDDSQPDAFSRSTARLLSDLSSEEVETMARLIRWALDRCRGQRITLVALDRDLSGGGEPDEWPEAPWRVLAFTSNKSITEPDDALDDMADAGRLLSLLRSSGVARKSSLAGWYDIDPVRVELDRKTLERLATILKQ